MNHSPKILLIQLSQIGDILLTTPCIREAKKAGADVHFLSFPMGRAVLNQNPYLSKHWIIDPRSSVNSQFRVLRSLRREHFDFVFDFINTPRSAFATWFSRPKKSVAFDSHRKLLYNTVVPAERSTHYIVDEKFLLLKEVGFLPKNYLLDFFWENSNIGQDTRQFLQGLPSEKILTFLSPTHKRLARRWPQENYAALADILAEKYNALIVWTWGPDEKNLALKCQNLMRTPSFVTPSTTLEELAYLFVHGDLFIGNSNGPSHIAVAERLPTLQIHGPTDTVSWCPLLGHKAVGGNCLIEQIQLQTVLKGFHDLLPIIKQRKNLKSKIDLRDSNLSAQFDHLMLPS